MKKLLDDTIFQKQQLVNSRKNDDPVDEDELRILLSNFSELYDNADNEQKKQLIRTFVRKIEFDPESREVSVEFYDDSVLQAIQHGEPYHNYC